MRQSASSPELLAVRAGMLPITRCAPYNGTLSTLLQSSANFVVQSRCFHTLLEMASLIETRSQFYIFFQFFGFFKKEKEIILYLSYMPVIFSPFAHCLLTLLSSSTLKFSYFWRIYLTHDRRRRRRTMRRGCKEEVANVCGALKVHVQIMINSSALS